MDMDSEFTVPIVWDKIEGLLVEDLDAFEIINVDFDAFELFIFFYSSTLFCQSC